MKKLEKNFESMFQAEPPLENIVYIPTKNSHAQLHYNQSSMVNCVCSLLLMAFYIMAQLPSLIAPTIPPSSISSSIHQEQQALLHSGWWN